MPLTIGSLTQHPARVGFKWYAATIFIGGLLLMHPLCGAKPEQPISFLDAVFTATSAVCVTGLNVRSTGNDFSLLGQVVILLLIQVGGVGIMTVTTFVTFQLGARQGLRQRALVAETLGARGDLDLRWVLGHVLRWTFALEAGGALLLFVRFLFEMPPNAALWHAVFHSVSAFCNAGFGLHDDSLTRYQGDWLVNGTVIALIVSGGIGFPVLLDIARNWSSRPQDIWEKLLLHTKLMLVGSAALLLLGAAAFLVLEWDGVLAGMSLPRRLLVALFHSTACRTAGFNTVDLRMLTTATLFLSILLMIVGAGPCSTGGGFKVSTFMVLVLRGWRTMLGYRQVFVGRRSISASAVERATATAMVFSAVAIVALTMLLAAEQSSQPHVHTGGLFMDAAFEVFSALGTVGLSTGMTLQLSFLGRLIVIVLMFTGRLGPISMFAALSRAERKQAIEYAQEEPLIG